MLSMFDNGWIIDELKRKNPPVLEQKEQQHFLGSLYCFCICVYRQKPNAPFLHNKALSIFFCILAFKMFCNFGLNAFKRTGSLIKLNINIFVSSYQDNLGLILSVFCAWHFMTRGLVLLKYEIKSIVRNSILRVLKIEIRGWKAILKKLGPYVDEFSNVCGFQFSKRQTKNDPIFVIVVLPRGCAVHSWYFCHIFQS